MGGRQEPCDVTGGAGRAKNEALMVAGALPAIPSAVQSPCFFKGSECLERGLLELLAWSSSPLNM